WHWSVPESVLGHVDVLWSGFGASVSEESTRPKNDAALIDGRVSRALGGVLEEGNVPTLELAGDQPHELIGALLHPLARSGVDGQLEEFRIETSSDGNEFEVAYEGVLKAARVEQAFLFDQP